MANDAEARFWSRFLWLGGTALTLAGLAWLLKANDLPGSGVAFSPGFLLAVVAIGGVGMRVLARRRD